MWVVQDSSDNAMLTTEDSVYLWLWPTDVSAAEVRSYGKEMLVAATKAEARERARARLQGDVPYNSKRIRVREATPEEVLWLMGAIETCG